MADALVPDFQCQRIEQALHGYQDGHRLITSSVQLKARDARTMLVLSDVSGPGARIPEGGYITGYPLLESGFFALARTWAATEMPRPGCVWTHTLLIELSDLAYLQSVKGVTDLFVRPTPPLNKLPYAQQLRMECIPTLNRKVSASKGILRAVLTALYQRTSECVILRPRLDTDVEELILAIWEQQWPRLRRNFLFCSLSFSDRSFENIKFDLQVLPSAKEGAGSKVRIPGYLVEEEISEKDSEYLPALEIALEDLMATAKTPFKEFIRTVGGDVEGGRKSYLHLCKIYAYLMAIEDDPSSFSDIISILQSWTESQEGSLARKRSVQKLLGDVWRYEKPPIELIMANLDLLDCDQVQEGAEKLGQLIWRENRHFIWDLLCEGGVRESIAKKAIEMQTVHDLIDALDEAKAQASFLLELRPDILTEPLFWKVADLENTRAIPLILSDPSIFKLASKAILDSGLNGLASKIYPDIDGTLFLEAVTDYVDDLKTEALDDVQIEWIGVAVQNKTMLATHLASKKVRSRRSLLSIAQATVPDYVPSMVGEDPWVTAMTNSSGCLSDPGRGYLGAYLLARAFGYASRMGGELVVVTLDDVYELAARSLLPFEAWKLLQPRLPWIGFFSEWDRCRKIRAAVVNMCLGREVPSNVFLRLTKDDNLFAGIVGALCKRANGKDYLIKVKKSIESSPDPDVNRLKCIEKELYR